MKRHFHEIFIFFLISTTIGCSIPKNTHTLHPPARSDKNMQIKDAKECHEEARKYANTPLTEVQTRRVESVETGRFSEGGRGNSTTSDRYMLCLLNKNYQLLKHPSNWFSETKCETLHKYKAAGLEIERLEHVCERKDTEQCKVCQSLH